MLQTVELSEEFDGSSSPDQKTEGFEAWNHADDPRIFFLLNTVLYLLKHCLLLCGICQRCGRKAPFPIGISYKVLKPEEDIAAIEEQLDHMAFVDALFGALGGSLGENHVAEQRLRMPLSLIPCLKKDESWACKEALTSLEFGVFAPFRRNKFLLLQ